MVKPKDIFERVQKHLGILPLSGKFVKMSKESAIFDHMLLYNQKAKFDHFLVLLKENNRFKLELKESFFISRDKSILNKYLLIFVRTA